MLLSKNEHNVRNTHMEDWNVTKPGFVDHFKTPTVGSKDGSYFLMGHCVEPKRSAQNLKEANLVILDCDSRLDENLDVVDGAPPVEQACNVLKESPWSCLLYTTFSHRKDRPRYRIVFFPDTPVKPENVSIVIKSMFEQFNKAGVPLAYTSESSKISQPWFFPRVKDEGQEYICRGRIEGEELQIEKILSEVPKEEKREDFRESLKKSLKDTEFEFIETSQWSPIDMFLQANTLEYIKWLLKKHGYNEKYATTDEFKYLAPGSTTKQPGLALFKGRDGKWRVVSYHGKDPLNAADKETGEKLALDAYDVLVKLEYEKDYKRAFEELKGQHGERLRKHFLDRFVYIAESDKVGDRLTGKSTPANLPFTNFTASAFWTAASGDPTKTGKRISAAKDWMSSGERVTAIGEDWKPIKVRTYLDENDKDANGSPQLQWNSYNAPEWDEIKSEEYLHFFIDHIKYLIPDKDDCEVFIQWLAERFQYPEKRALFTPLHISRLQGTGRGWIVNLMGKLMGAGNCSSVTIKELTASKGFNEYLDRKRFCAIHEVDEKERSGFKYQINSRIRTLLTEDRLLIDHKFGSKSDKQIYVSIFMMSNQKDCLVIPKEDRRLFVIEGNVELKESKYYKTLKELLHNEQFLREVFWYLKRLDITRIRSMSTAPKNEARAGLVGVGMSDTEDRFNMMLNNPPGLVWTSTLVQTYINHLEGLEFPIIHEYGDVRSEIKKLFKAGLSSANNGGKGMQQDKGDVGNLAGKGTVRVRVHEDFPEEDINDLDKLRRGLKETVKAIESLLLATPAD